MKPLKFLKENILFKITSLNAAVIIFRLIIGFFIQRELTQFLGKSGYAKVGSLRNLMQILNSVTSLGVFNGIIKYVAENKENKRELRKVFSTSLVFVLFGSVISFIFLFFNATYVSEYFFYTSEFSYLIKLIAIITPLIGVQKIFNGLINGLSKYKKFVKIELFTYCVSSIIVIFSLYNYHLHGVLFAIAIIPVVQLLIMLFLLFKLLKEYIPFSKLQLNTPYRKNLLAFTSMSLVSGVFLNYLEVNIRGMIEYKISIQEAGIWTGMTTLSKNYMVFSNAIFTLYVIPKFTRINSKENFFTEIGKIYKTLLPIFAIGMILIYFLRFTFIQYVFIGFDEMAPLFKWQLLGDFVRLASIILAYQFVAKKLVKSFIFTEIISLGLFFILSYFLVDIYGVSGVTIAHFLRYIVYFFVVLLFILHYFSKAKQIDENG